jgi:hypothetical protein
MALTRINNQALTNVTSAGLPSGTVLQVKQTVKTDTFSTTSTSFVDVTGLSVTITPSSSSNKIFVMYEVVATNTLYVSQVNLVRGSTNLSQPDTASNRPTPTSARTIRDELSSTHGGTSHHTRFFLDSPATTSATTYKIQTRSRSSNTTYVNYSETDRDTSEYDPRHVSTITVMEIAG